MMVARGLGVEEMGKMVRGVRDTGFQLWNK